MKRGMNSLVASILIIGFVIVLGILVFSWQNRLVGSIQERSDKEISAAKSCLDLNIDILKACYDDKIHILVRNNGNEDLREGFQVIIFNDLGESEIAPSLQYPFLQAHSTQEIIAATSFSRVESIVVIPKIRVEDDLLYCMDSDEKAFLEEC